jgi:hypothetical protein
VHPILPVTDPRDLKVEDARLGALWRHWLAARAGRLMPARRSLDPTAMPATLPHLFLFDYHAATERFYCRLSGGEINLVVRTNCARHFLDELFPPQILAVVNERYKRVVLTPTLAYMQGSINMANGARVPGERLILPLSDDGVVATGLIGGSIYRLPDAFKAGAWVDEPLVETSFSGLPPPQWMPD